MNNKKRQRYTLLITNDFPPIVSGISTVFYHVWKHLPKDKVIVLSPRVEGSREFDSASGIPTIRYPFLVSGSTVAKLINQAFLFLYTVRLIVAKGITGIHCGQILSSGSLGLFFKGVFNIPYYLWVYGDETKAIYRGSMMSRYIVDKILYRAKRIITNSAYVTQEFIDFGIPKEKIVEILPAVDPDVFKPAAKPQYLVEKYNLKGKKVILTVSRLVRRKGHECVIRALPNLRAVFHGIVYLIVGKGPEETNLRNLAGSLGVADNVVFAGYIPDSGLPDFYNVCDIFVMPNREDTASTDSIEGFGIVFIEANACEKPVIGGRSGGVVNGALIDGVTGFLVDPLNVEKLTEKILVLLTNDELSQRLARAGRERIEKNFRWQDRAKTIMDITK